MPDSVWKSPNILLDSFQHSHENKTKADLINSFLRNYWVVTVMPHPSGKQSGQKFVEAVYTQWTQVFVRWSIVHNIAIQFPLKKRVYLTQVYVTVGRWYFSILSGTDMTST